MARQLETEHDKAASGGEPNPKNISEPCGTRLNWPSSCRSALIDALAEEDEEDEEYEFVAAF